jgi:opine dehydrogenase
MSRQGHQVTLYEHPNFAKNLEGISANRGIEMVEHVEKDGHVLTSNISGFARIANATTDIGEACDNADLIMMIVPSFAQEPLFQILLPHLRHGAVLALLPGNFGSLILKPMMADAGIRRDVVVAETNSIPYACRIVGPGQVFITGVKQTINVGFLPATSRETALRALKEVFPIALSPVSNVLEIGLNNPNSVAHVATAVLNMGLAESRQGRFFFYKEGMSESVSKVQQAIDNERVAVGQALGLEMMTFIELVKLFYDLTVTSIREFATTTPVHNTFGYDFPRSPRERYISEDAPFLLVPLHSFAQSLGVPVPATESIIRVASLMNETDFFLTGRTVETLGLSGKSRDEMLDSVR